MRAVRELDRGVMGVLVTLALLLGAGFYIDQFRREGAGFFTLPRGMLLHDFAYFWGGARLFWAGQVGQVFAPDQFNAWLASQLAPGSMQQYATWSYPPTMLLPLLAFGLLPLPIAYLAWIATTFGLLAVVLRSVLQDRLLALTVLLSPAAMYALYYGQNGALTAALLIAGVWLVDRRPILAGLCIGLLAIKPQLALLLPFALAAGGYWRAFVAAVAMSLALVAVSLLLFGVSSWIGFVQTTMPLMSGQLMHAFGIPPQHAMPTMWVTLQGWGADTRRAAIGQTLSTVLAIALVARAWWLPIADRQWRIALTCTLPLLATPFGYVYDATPAMLAVALIARHGVASGLTWAERPVLAAVWVWPVISVLWSFLFGLHPIGAFLLWAQALCLWWRIERAAAASRQGAAWRLPAIVE